MRTVATPGPEERIPKAPLSATTQLLILTAQAAEFATPMMPLLVFPEALQLSSVAVVRSSPLKANALLSRLELMMLTTVEKPPVGAE